MNYKYPREEKLKQKMIFPYFLRKENGKLIGNIRLISFSSEEITQHKVGVSVSKRYFKKRWIEIEQRDFERAYRLHKLDF